MWTPDPNTTMLPDVRRFIDLLNQHHAFFDPDAPITVARAPGRLDLMGGIADYSGALVLQLPLGAATFAAVQPVADPTIRIYSTEASADANTVELPLTMLMPSEGPLSYAHARALLGDDPARAWAAYVAGVLVVLRREQGMILDHGLRIFIHSEVPAGKGVSSSAALEVATMQAVGGALGGALDARTLAILCQMVENHVVGAPCGIMDQMASACGREGQLMALLCQPAELQPPVALPAALAVWGVDSGIRHAVGGADYGSVRAAAFMGYRIIADHVGLHAQPSGAGRVRIDDARWHGYLANVGVAQWEGELSAVVPDHLSGANFLERYGGSTDDITEIDPHRTYAVRQATAHPIYEHARVTRFRELLLGPQTEDAHRELGALMVASHRSYSACGLGTAGTDRLVELVQEAGPSSGVYGAKITGGGSGGTVAILGRHDADAVVEAIATRYSEETSRDAHIFRGSSPGAAAWGTLRLHKDGA
jgi:galactokinase